MINKLKNRKNVLLKSIEEHVELINDNDDPDFLDIMEAKIECYEDEIEFLDSLLKDSQNLCEVCRFDPNDVCVECGGQAFPKDK